MRRWSLAWVAALGLAACQVGAPGRYPVALERVGGGEFGDAALRAAVDAALADSPEFGGAGGGLGGSLRLHAWVSASDQPGRMGELPPAVRPATQFLHLELEVPADLRPQFDVAAIGARVPVDESGPAAATRAALRVLELRLGLARGEHAAATELLGAADPDLVGLALEWVRDHPGADLADAVAGAVDRTADPQVVALGLEILGAIGDARHAPAVVRRVEKSPGLAREAYRALGQLGGADAVGFLRFAAANEDEAALRGEAERALATALAGATERVAVRPHGVDLPRMVRGHRQ